jgi:Amt family ammonium transporter
VAGLVAITPGSGYVPAWSAVVFGVVAGIGCNYATKLKYLINCDDALDIFAAHAIGGLIGNLLTGLFAAQVFTTQSDVRSLTTYSNYIAHLDGVTIIPGGWLNHNYRQLGIQLAGSVAGGGYSFVVSVIILTIINFIGKYLSVFRLRASLEEEDLGIDDVEIGEFAVCMTSPLLKPN